MIDRRQFLQYSASAGIALSVPEPSQLRAAERLPKRPIPGTDQALPIIGLGNSNAFRQGDRDTTRALIELFASKGGAYIDCGGSSRFTVADVAKDLALAGDLFLGAYFTGGNKAAARGEAERLRAMTGKAALDLMHSYPEDAVPHWDAFRRWKGEGLTRFIGVARHQSRYYDAMMTLMQTGTVDFLQVNYSPLETEADQRILPMALDKGVAVTINRPFLNGEYFQIVRNHALPAWAAEFDCESWAQFSLKFILSHPAVNCVLTETANPRHAADNLGAGFGRLPDEKTRQRIVAHLKNLA